MSQVTLYFIFFFKQKTAYEMRISDWSSDVCSSDLHTINCQAPSRAESPRTDRSCFGHCHLLDYDYHLSGRGPERAARGKRKGATDGKARDSSSRAQARAKARRGWPARRERPPWQPDWAAVRQNDTSETSRGVHVDVSVGR